MALFGILDTSASALRVNKMWLAAVSDNIANINVVRRTTEDAFQARIVVAESNADTDGDGIGNGIHTAGIALGSAQGMMVNDPGNPLADAQGNVRRPDINLGDQMVQMMMAQRSYQANLAIVDRARDMYMQAMGIGK